MLDLETLRVVQSSVAVCAFGLVYLGTYRATRAPFAGWWSAALAASGLTSVILVLGEGSLSVTFAAFGNAVAVVGALFTWMAARSLRRLRLSWWVPLAVGVAVGLGTLIEHPRGDAWPGGAILLVGMSWFVGLAAVELWTVRRHNQRGANRRTNDGEKDAAIVSMAIASTAISTLYAMRAVAYVAVGPASWFYETWAGPVITTFIMTLVLLVVTYSVTTLSHDRLARHWKQRAMNDDLTGLLTRTEFGERAASLVNEAPAAVQPAMIVADLDHFKAINDRLGHAAGDKALVSFAEAVRLSIGAQDIAARFGGEEFVFLIADSSRQQATEVARDIDRMFAAAGTDELMWPTVSYGVALWDRLSTLDDLVARADRALYEAKRRGRAQTVFDEEACG